MKNKHLLSFAAVVLALGATAACSSSNGGNGDHSSASAPSPSPTFTGPDIKVGLIGDFSTVSIMGNPQPMAPAAANASLDVVNAAGGVHGSKVVLDACDDKGNPNTAADCARKFVSDGVVATIGDDTPYGDQLNPVLQAAGIPRIAPLALSAAEYTMPNNYPVNGGAVVGFQGAVISAADHGYKSIFTVYTESSGSSTLTGLVTAAATARGMKDKGSVGIPTSATDLSSYVTKAERSGADVVVTTFGVALTQQFVQTSIQLGATYKIATLAESLTNDVIKAVGASQPIVQSAMLTSPFPPIDDNSIAGVKKFNDEMDAREKAGDKAAGQAPRNIQAWLSGHLFQQIADTITGSVTAKTVTAALGTVKDLDTYGVMPPWTPSAPGGMLPRVSNGTMWFLKVQDGKQVLDKDTPQQVTTVPSGS
jgi:ABC-type branched-subunit amino acid transport system substrate-binding protein